MVEIDCNRTFYPQFQSCQRQNAAAAAHVHQVLAGSLLQILQHEAKTHFRGGMVRRESFATLKKNTRRGPVNYKTKPGTTDCQRAIDTIVEKHLGHYAMRLTIFAFKFGHEGHQSL